jgi:hypothetical protein
MTFHSAPVVDEPGKDENYDHKDLDESKPVLRLSCCRSASEYLHAYSSITHHKLERESVEVRKQGQ